MTVTTVPSAAPSDVPRAALLTFWTAVSRSARGVVTVSPSAVVPEVAIVMVMVRPLLV